MLNGAAPAISWHVRVVPVYTAVVRTDQAGAAPACRMAPAGRADGADGVLVSSPLFDRGGERRPDCTVGPRGGGKGVHGVNTLSPHLPHHGKAVSRPPAAPPGGRPDCGHPFRRHKEGLPPTSAVPWVPLHNVEGIAEYAGETVVAGGTLPQPAGPRSTPAEPCPSPAASPSSEAPGGAVPTSWPTPSWAAWSAAWAVTRRPQVSTASACRVRASPFNPGAVSQAAASTSWSRAPSTPPTCRVSTSRGRAATLGGPIAPVCWAC